MTDRSETPTGRLRELLEAQFISGDDVPDVVSRVIPQLPLGDAQTWMRAGVDKETRRYAREHDLVLNHQADRDDGPAPAQVWVQYTIEEVVTHIRHVSKQIDDDDNALERRLEVWCEAHPEAGATPADLRAAAAA